LYLNTSNKLKTTDVEKKSRNINKGPEAKLARKKHRYKTKQKKSKKLLACTNETETQSQS